MPVEALVSATLQDGLIEITDGALSYWCDLEPGDFSWQDGVPEAIYNLTREKLAPYAGGAPDMRLGAEQPASGSFTLRLRSLSSTTETTAMDLIRSMATDTAATSYVASVWASTHPYSDAKTRTLKYHLRGTHRGVPDQTMVWDYVYFRPGAGAEGNPSTIQVQWTAGVPKARIE